MSTDALLQRFEAGDLGDAGEWFDWEAIAALKAEAERKLGRTWNALVSDPVRERLDSLRARESQGWHTSFEIA